MSKSIIKIVFALLIVSPALAGCVSDDDGGAPPATGVNTNAGGIPTNDLDDENVTIDDGTGDFNETGAGHLPHVHNYWNGREVVTLLEKPVNIEVLSDVTFYNVFFYRQPTAGGAIVQLEDGQLVYEGAGKMLITASWTDATVTGVALTYKHASSQDFEPGVSLSSGETVELAVTPDMTDMAHQLSSRWLFVLYASGAAASVAQGTVDLKIEIVKMRDIAVLPGHPETYVNAQSYDIADTDAHSANYNMATLAVAVATNTYTDDWIVPTDIVRMGTTAVIAQVDVVNAADSLVTTVSAARLFVRTPASAFRAYEATLIESMSDVANGKYVFGFTVDDSIVDGPYEDDSMWRFMALPEETTAAGGACAGACGGATLDYHIQVVTHKENPTGSDLQPLREIRRGG